MEEEFGTNSQAAAALEKILLEGEIASFVEYVGKKANRISNPLSGPAQDCIIRRVNPLLYSVNKAAYESLLVRVGPHYHRSSSNLSIEKGPWVKYVCSFLQRPHNEARLKEFGELIQNSLPKIHSCYEGGGYGIEYIFMDAAFIIELFLRDFYKGRRESESDFIFDSPGMIHDIRRDLLLAKYQLPLFILTQIYQLAFSTNSDYPSFIHLSCNFFRHYANQNISIHDQSHVGFRAKLEGAKHFTDLVRTLVLSYSFQNHRSNEEPKSKDFVASIRSSLFPSSGKEGDNRELEAGQAQGEYLYSATLLLEAGVKFKVSSSRALIDINFNKNNGELTIPCLKVDRRSEAFFRNLMVWEQSYYPRETHICDYVFLLEYLIQSTEDVALLVRKRIIINQLGSHKTLLTLFNNLTKHIPQGEKSIYSEIFKELNAYNSVKRHGWMAILKQQYFSTPWRGVATIAAVVLLLLTLIQTICAIISL